jgi:hypothetical protein
MVPYHFRRSWHRLLGGGSLAPTEYGRRPFAVRSMIAVSVRGTALSAVGGPETAIMERA